MEKDNIKKMFFLSNYLWVFENIMRKKNHVTMIKKNK